MDLLGQPVICPPKPVAASKNFHFEFLARSDMSRCYYVIFEKPENGVNMLWTVLQEYGLSTVDASHDSRFSFLFAVPTQHNIVSQDERTSSNFGRTRLGWVFFKFGNCSVRLKNSSPYPKHFQFRHCPSKWGIWPIASPAIPSFPLLVIRLTSAERFLRGAEERRSKSR